MEVKHNPEAIDAFECECIDCQIKQSKITRLFNLNPPRTPSYHFVRHGTPLGKEFDKVDGEWLGAAF